MTAIFLSSGTFLFFQDTNLPIITNHMVTQHLSRIIRYTKQSDTVPIRMPSIFGKRAFFSQSVPHSMLGSGARKAHTIPFYSLPIIFITLGLQQSILKHSAYHGPQDRFQDQHWEAGSHLVDRMSPRSGFYAPLSAITSESKMKGERRKVSDDQISI